MLGVININDSCKEQCIVAPVLSTYENISLFVIDILLKRIVLLQSTVYQR